MINLKVSPFIELTSSGKLIFKDNSRNMKMKKVVKGGGS